MLLMAANSLHKYIQKSSDSQSERLLSYEHLCPNVPGLSVPPGFLTILGDRQEAGRLTCL